MKAGRQSSTPSRRNMWTVVIEDIKGNTTITRMRGTNISHKTCKYPNRGGRGTCTPFVRYSDPSMGGIALKPMKSSLNTIRNYPRGACLDPALLSCIRADIPLFTLKSDDKSIKRRKWAVCRKAARDSSKAPCGDLWTVVIEDIKGFKTITRVRGDQNITQNVQISQSGWRGHIYTLWAIFRPPA